jgi:RimJ/RimL family protein N-acetyltransferase
VIETERLFLRPWRLDDRETFARIVADAEVADWLGGARVQAPDYFDAMLAFRDQHGHGSLAITLKPDGAVIGRVGLRRMPPEWNHPMGGEVEVGWLLARDAWGHGYASEAGAAVLAWGFAALRVPEIFSWTAEANRRSQAVMRRVGMVRASSRDFDQPDVAADDPLRRHVVYVAIAPGAAVT